MLPFIPDVDFRNSSTRIFPTILLRDYRDNAFIAFLSIDSKYLTYFIGTGAY